MLGLVTLVTAIAIILLVTLSLNSAEDAAQATTNHNTKSLTSTSFEKKVIEYDIVTKAEEKAENMKIGAYANGFVINYNTQRTPGKGSAIFFHIGNSYTLGCTATSEANVVKIMKWLDPAKNPVIIQTPTQNISNY